MNEVLNDLEDAIDLVPSSFYGITRMIVEDGELNQAAPDVVIYEDRFVVKLTSNFDRIINSKPDFYLNCYTDGMILKHFLEQRNEGNYLYSTYSRLKSRNTNLGEIITTIPDFIIHAGQENFTLENQKLVIEVKTTNRLKKNDFFWDFFKLNVYVDFFNFQNGVYLILRQDFNRIVRLLEKYINKGYYLTDNNLDNIHFFIKFDYNDRISKYSLREILGHIENQNPH